MHLGSSVFWEKYWSREIIYGRDPCLSDSGPSGNLRYGTANIPCGEDPTAFHEPLGPFLLFPSAHRPLSGRGAETGGGGTAPVVPPGASTRRFADRGARQSPSDPTPVPNKHLESAVLPVGALPGRSRSPPGGTGGDGARRGRQGAPR